MERTKELDRHWNGQFWCLTCQLYTGQPENHQGHFAEALPALVFGGLYGGQTFYLAKVEDIGTDSHKAQRHADIIFYGKRIQ